MISFMGIPVTALITKSKIPYGGVIKPIIELTTTNTPKCTRSIPSALQAGIKSGTITKMIVVASKKQPKISTKILIKIIINPLDLPMLALMLKRALKCEK